jgi:hypothetical protein
MQLIIDDEQHYPTTPTPAIRMSIGGDPIGRHKPASPELVRRVVLEAAAAWPELAGWDANTLIGTDKTGIGRGSACLASLVLRRDTYANLREDAAALAAKAAEAVRALPKPVRATSFPLLDTPLDRAQLDRQWARALGVAPPEPYRWRTSAPAARPEHLARQGRRTGLDVEREIAERTGGTCPIAAANLAGAEALPTGWRWGENDGPKTVRAYRDSMRGGFCRFDANGFDENDSMPQVRQAVEARARRLGLIGGEPQRTPLPEGWGWHDELACLAREQGGGNGRWAGIRANRRTPFSEGQIPTEVWTAVITEARRLGLIKGEHTRPSMIEHLCAAGL